MFKFKVFGVVELLCRSHPGAKISGSPWYDLTSDTEQKVCKQSVVFTVAQY